MGVWQWSTNARSRAKTGDSQSDEPPNQEEDEERHDKGPHGHETHPVDLRVCIGASAHLCVRAP